MKTFTLAQLLESAMSCFKTGLAEAAAPRNNEGDARRCWFEGLALMSVDSMGWHAATHNWPNEALDPKDRLDDDERRLFQEANALYSQLHAELERLWSIEE